MELLALFHQNDTVLILKWISENAIQPTFTSFFFFWLLRME
jgi:hypothetical protein